MGVQVASLFGVLELVDKFTPGLKAAQKNTDEFGKGVGGAIERVTALSSAMAAIPGAAFLVGAVKAAADFDKSMTNVGAVLGKTKDQMGSLNQEVLNIGKNSVAGPQKAAEAFYDIVGGVADASTHMAILNAAIKTSEAGAADLGATTSGLISVMNAYKFSADKASFASDVLTTVVGKGVGSMDQMVAAISPISGLAASAGIKFNDMGAAIAFMTTKGQTASQAATQYKAAIVALLNPNTQMAAAIRKTGAASGSALIQQYGLVGAMNKLKASVGGSQDAMAKMFGSVEALQAVTALATDDFGEFSESFQSSMNGATDAARRIQLGSFSAQFEIFKNNLIGVAIAAGNVLLPALTGLFSIFNGLMGLINRFDPNLLGLVAAFTALGVVVPAILPLFGALAGALVPLLAPIALLVGAFTAVKLAWDSDFGGIRTNVTAFVNAVKPQIDQIGKGIKAFFDILNAPAKMTLDTEGMDANSARLTKKLNKLDPNDGLTKAPELDFGTKLKNAIDTAWPMIEPALTTLVANIAKFGAKIVTDFVAGIVGLGQSIVKQIQDELGKVDIGKEAANLLTKALKFGSDLVANILSGLTNIYTDVTAKISSIDAVDIGKQAANLLINALKFGADLIGKIVSGLTGGGTQIEGQISTETGGLDFGTMASKLLDAAFKFSTTLLGKIVDGLVGFGTKVGDELGAQFSKITLDDVINAIKDIANFGIKLGEKLISTPFNIGADLGKKLGEELAKVDIIKEAKSLLDNALKLGGDLIGKIVSSIGALGHDFGFAIQDNFGSIDLLAAAKTLLDNALKIGGDLIKGILDGLKGLGDKIINFIKDELGKIVSGVKDTAENIGKDIANFLGINVGGGKPAQPPANAPATTQPMPNGAGVQMGAQPGQPAKPLNLDIVQGREKGTATNPLVVQPVAPAGAQAGQQAAAQPAAPVNLAPVVAPVAQQAAGQAGAQVAMGGQNPVEPIVQAAVAWLQSTGAAQLTAAFKAAMDAGAAAFQLAGMAAIPAGVINPLNLAVMWVNTVGRAGVVTTFAALATSANAALKGVGSSMVSSVADALIRIATMIGNLPNGVGAALAAGIRAAAASGRARGGAIGSGMYLVGEHGPELIQLGAGQSGHVYENSLVRGAKGAGSGGNGGGITLHNPVFQGVQDPESLLDQLERVAGRYNQTIMRPI